VKFKNKKSNVNIYHKKYPQDVMATKGFEFPAISFPKRSGQEK